MFILWEKKGFDICCILFSWLKVNQDNLVHKALLDLRVLKEYQVRGEHISHFCWVRWTRFSVCKLQVTLVPLDFLVWEDHLDILEIMVPQVEYCPVILACIISHNLILHLLNVHCQSNVMYFTFYFKEYKQSFFLFLFSQVPLGFRDPKVWNHGVKSVFLHRTQMKFGAFSSTLIFLIYCRPFSTHEVKKVS